ncbi:MAG: DUF3347 domain-containing protein [Chitinophagaceae bacterium]|nr:DUF3347 domain-containing protein [Chitinophagaceae bacterium]
MKQIFTLLLCSGALQVSAQQISNVLPAYYNVKEALISGNEAMVTHRSADLMHEIEKAAPSIPEPGRSALVSGSRSLATATSLDKQRSLFATVSEEMAAAVKAAHPAGTTVYKMYCPMKKAYWLSNEATIRNPYYGKSMLSCGNVSETIK